MKNNLIIGVIVALIIGGGVGFFAGMTYQKNQKPNFATFSANGGNFQGGQRGNGQFRTGGANGIAGSRPTIGEIISSDDKSITVKLQDGSSKIVILTDKTSVNKEAEGTREDLKTGTNVMVIGTSNSDGSETATNIQLNPGNRFFQRISPVPSK
jgi:hypothetical protein